MAAQQRRMLSAERGKLSKADLTTILRKEGAWGTLHLETQTRLYALLPEPQPDDEPHDVSVNPLKTKYRPFIEEAFRIWQEDLKAGKETKKWREEAMHAGHDRAEGKFDEYEKAQREEYWGDAAGGDEKSTSIDPDGEVNGDNDGNGDDGDDRDSVDEIVMQT